MKVGDRVAYSAEWLISTFQQSGEAAFRRGEIISITPISSTSLANVKWDDGVTYMVNVANLAVVGPNMRFARC